MFASGSTWLRQVRERGWRRPRARVHPAKPTVGLRTTRRDEVWHIDTTLIRLLNGSKVYVHAVIDNFSRRIVAFRVTDRFDIGSTIAVVLDAAKNTAANADRPMLLCDGGVENFNGAVDALVTTGLLRRVLAQTEISFSNSMTEAFWRTMKHVWLYLNTLDSVAAVARLVSTYVAAHNAEIPHSALRGQAPDEMYFGTGEGVPEELEQRRQEARAARLAQNREVCCDVCPGRPGANTDAEARAAA